MAVAFAKKTGCKMLKYDEWVVPGEVEYAEQKAAEIESQIQKYHENFLRDKYGFFVDDIYIRITEHVIGKFKVKMANSLVGIPPDYDVYNYMKLDWFQDVIAPIDAPKIFDLPADDIRRNLPDWDESLLPDDARRKIMRLHSLRYRVSDMIEKLEDGDYSRIERQLHLGEDRFDRTMEAFIKKLSIEDKAVSFTELEEKIGLILSEKYCFHAQTDPYQQTWCFPMTMKEEAVVDAVRKAYWNASKRSRRIMPNKLDGANLDRLSDGSFSIENYECLYQGKAGDLLIHFLFDFKEMRIAMAYPVLKEISLQRWCYERGYYNKELKHFSFRSGYAAVESL